MMDNRSMAAQRLIALLRAHDPADAKEAADVRRTLEWLTVAANPLDRHQFNPGHAVGSALIATPDRQQVLLVLHAKLNRWLQPGGHAEPQEIDLARVAAREALEEVGFTLDPETARFCDLDIHGVPARTSAPAHLHFDFRFHFETPLTPATAASDALEARWFKIDEALQMDLDPGLRRMIGKLR
jgi:8-oxo-dGTP pyrophosphatase MutT (NUDIX family)